MPPPAAASAAATNIPAYEPQGEALDEMAAVIDAARTQLGAAADRAVQHAQRVERRCVQVRQGSVSEPAEHQSARVNNLS